jgi:hypothetical protein
LGEDQLETRSFFIKRCCDFVGATDNNTNETKYQFPKEPLTVYRNGNSHITRNNIH